MTRMRLQLVVPEDADPAIVAILETARTELTTLAGTRLAQVELVARRQTGPALCYKLKVNVIE